MLCCVSLCAVLPRNRTYIVPIYLFYHIVFGFASRPRTLLKNLQKRHEGAFLAEALKKTENFATQSDACHGETT